MKFTRWERVEGGILGLLVGDALGVPYEFHEAAEIPPASAIELEPPDGFRRAHARVPAGTWSDDGAQALCLLASLLDKDRLDLDDFGARLVDWHAHGYMAVDGIVFDVGIQTTTALRALAFGARARNAGSTDEWANGNGSLMRVLPLALWHRGTDEELVRDAHEQSRVTHGHPLAQVCCALYCLWARRELEAESESWRHTVSALRAIYLERYPTHSAQLEDVVCPDAEPSGSGTGYVLDCLHSVRIACRASTYESIVKDAVALGNDTDTTACVAGGIAGVRYGRAGIPARWLAGLRGRDLVDPLIARLRAQQTGA